MLDRALDALPNASPFGVAQLKHPVNHARRLDQRIGAVALEMLQDVEERLT